MAKDILFSQLFHNYNGIEHNHIKTIRLHFGFETVRQSALFTTAVLVDTQNYFTKF